MVFGGAGEVFGTAWVLAQNRDKIIAKYEEAKRKAQNWPQKNMDARYDPQRFNNLFDISA